MYYSGAYVCTYLPLSLQGSSSLFSAAFVFVCCSTSCDQELRVALLDDLISQLDSDTAAAAAAAEVASAELKVWMKSLSTLMLDMCARENGKAAWMHACMPW